MGLITNKKKHTQKKFKSFDWVLSLFLYCDRSNFFFLFFFHSALSVRVGFFSLPLIMAVSVNVWTSVYGDGHTKDYLKIIRLKKGKELGFACANVSISIHCVYIKKRKFVLPDFSSLPECNPLCYHVTHTRNCLLFFFNSPMSIFLPFLRE